MSGVGSTATNEPSGVSERRSQNDLGNAPRCAAGATRPGERSNVAAADSPKNAAAIAIVAVNPIPAASVPAVGDATMKPTKNAPYTSPIARPSAARGTAEAACALMIGSDAVLAQYRMELTNAPSQRVSGRSVSAPRKPDAPLATI